MKITFKSTGQADREIAIFGGLTLMEAAVQNDIDEIEALCGGGCSCATCHVYITDEWREIVGPPSAMEAEMLEGAEHVTPASRLSCQITLTSAMDGLVVYLPSEEDASKF